MSWAHINMLGEYDFSDEKLKDSVGILPLKHPQIQEAKKKLKANHITLLQNDYVAFCTFVGMNPSVFNKTFRIELQKGNRLQTKISSKDLLSMSCKPKSIVPLKSFILRL